MPDLPPATPRSPGELHGWAKARSRERGISVYEAGNQIAREYGHCCSSSMLQLIRHHGTAGFERALLFADAEALERELGADPAAASRPFEGLPPLLALLRRSVGCRFHAAEEVRRCVRLLLDAGADPGGRSGSLSALEEAVHRVDPLLVRMLVERGAVVDEDVFYLACDNCGDGWTDGPEVAIADLLWVHFEPSR